MIALEPTALGMALNHWLPGLCRRATGAVNLASMALFVLVLAGAILSQKDDLGGFFRQVGFPVLVLNVATMAVGYFSKKGSGKNGGKIRDGGTGSVRSATEKPDDTEVVPPSQSALKLPPFGSGNKS